MTFDEIITKYTMSKSSADIEIVKIPRRQSLYKGEGKIKNKKTVSRFRQSAIRILLLNSLNLRSVILYPNP